MMGHCAVVDWGSELLPSVGEDRRETTELTQSRPRQGDNAGRIGIGKERQREQGRRSSRSGWSLPSTQRHSPHSIPSIVGPPLFDKRNFCILSILQSCWHRRPKFMLLGHGRFQPICCGLSDDGQTAEAPTSGSVKSVTMSNLATTDQTLTRLDYRAFVVRGLVLQAA